MNLRGCWAIGVVACSLLAATGAPALAQDGEFAFGMGYGHLFWDGSHTDELEEQGGFVIDTRFTWAVSPQPGSDRPELRAGVGLGLEFYISGDSDDDFTIINGEVFVEAGDFNQLSIISPYLEIAWRQPLQEHWYIEPGLAGRFLVGNYVKGQEFFGLVDEDIDRWRVGGAGKAFLRLAYQEPRWALGVEGSYSYGWLDFGGDVGGDIQEGYLGLFYAHRF